MGLKSLWLVSVCCYADYWDAMNSTLLDSRAEAVTNRKIWLIGQHNMHICYPKEKYMIITEGIHDYWRGYVFPSIWHTSVYQKPVTSLSFGSDMLPVPRNPSVSNRASWETLCSLCPTTKHHSLWPHLSESLPVTCALLPTMSVKVINNGFDLNWLLLNWMCP